MIGIYIDILSLTFLIIFVLILLKIILPLSKKEMKDFTWDNYFKQVNIYQSRSWHHDLWDLLVKLR